LFCDESRVEALVLHEQPNAGRTVIEKFEQYTDVGFAVGLLTLGDVGAAKNDGANLPPPRARQNVMKGLVTSWAF
jgi:predicted nucleotide-binding protein